MELPTEVDPYKDLLKKHPILFPNGWKSMMIPGFDVGLGWISILDEAFTELEKLKAVEIHQVKQKWDLRIYLSGPPEAHDIVERANKKACVTCEWCGEPGIGRDDLGWFLTLCEIHYKERLSEREKTSCNS